MLGRLGFQGPILTSANQPMDRPLATRFREQLIDVAFTIGDTDALRGRRLLG